MEELREEAASAAAAASAPVVSPSNQAVSLSTAGMRALIYQLQALYLRTPIKLFRPSRFDYMVYVRELANKHDNIASKPYSIRTHSSIAMLVNVMKKEGWRFIPDQLLPPLVANSATGVILYATYLTALDAFDSTHPNDKRKDFNYSPLDTWRAGYIAGAVQSLAAAPVDAIYTRLTTAEIISGEHQNLWRYGIHKLREIGLVGVFAGYGFSFIKESLGFAFYFSTFELVKTRGYNLTYRVISSYRRLKLRLRKIFAFLPMGKQETNTDLVRMEQNRLAKILKSSFILLAGASAAFSLLAVQYPLTKIQKIHLGRLEALDIYNSATHANLRRPFIKVYYNSYIDTYFQIRKMKQKAGATWFLLAYKGFARNALTTIPATSVGLLVFEIMRTRLSDSLDDVHPLDS